VLVTTTPIFAGLMGHISGRDRLTPKVVVGMAVALFGGSVIAADAWAGAQSRVFGNALALGGAVMMASFLTIGRSIRPHFPLWPYVLMTVTPAAAFLWVACLGLGVPMVGFTPQTWLMFFLLAAIPQLVGHSLLVWALRFASAAVVSITVLGEPVGSTLLAFLLLDESPKFLEVIGGLLILVGIFLATRAGGKNKP
jgi:drug/metabolite transporter (DMT)-like permease